MISKEQFEVIEEYFGNEIKDNMNISIHATEYVEMEAEEAAAFPELENYYGVISFMNEGDENFIISIYKMIGEFGIQYEFLTTKMETHQGDYGEFATVCFIEVK